MPVTNTTPAATAAPAATALPRLTYGVELETICSTSRLDDQGISVGGYHSGRPLPSHFMRPVLGIGAWRAETDSSIEARDYDPEDEDDGWMGVEFVSPVLSGPEGLDSIAEICSLIRQRLGGYVNSTCGVHVHVAFPVDDVEAMRRLHAIVARHEAALYAMSGSPARTNGHYCQSIRDTTVRNYNWSRKTKCEIQMDMQRGYMGCIGDRYRLLNWTNYLMEGRPNTVEFRVFSGSLNPDKIAAWVRVCLAMVEMAIDAGAASGWDIDPQVLASRRGRTESERRVQYLMEQITDAGRMRGRKYGELGHARFTRNRATSILKALAARYDERVANGRARWVDDSEPTDEGTDGPLQTAAEATREAARAVAVQAPDATLTAVGGLIGEFHQRLVSAGMPGDAAPHIRDAALLEMVNALARELRTRSGQAAPAAPAAEAPRPA